MDLDILIIAAHPDDAEIGMGGTIAKLIFQGNKVGILDLSEGEMSSNGTVMIRKDETDQASKILNINLRENLRFPDGNIKSNEDFVLKVVKKIREHRPRVIFAPYFQDRHPDHIGTSQIVKQAVFYSGLNKYDTDLGGETQIPYRPDNLYYYMQVGEFKPSFIVDISDFIEIKMSSLNAYKTQFISDQGSEKTFISDPKFLKFIEARARYYGFKIKKEYGEAFFSEEAIQLDTF